jgi:glycosyltransferase involved in cell wall biosynthesis
MAETVPVASVCIPTFNRERLLKRAVASARAQTERRIEILISDNASGDGTADLARDLAKEEPRLRYVRNAQNIGMVGNWNRCLAEARAPLISLLSDDDTLAPCAVETCLEALSRHPAAVICFGANLHCRDSGEWVNRNRPFRRERLLSPAEAHCAIWTRNCFQLTHAIFRADVARQVGGFAAEVGWCADTHFELRMAARGPILFSPVELGTYYLHPGQLSGSDVARVYRWQRLLVDRIMNEVRDVPELKSLRPLAERGYLASCAVHFAARSLKRGQSEECRQFLRSAASVGLPLRLRHKTMYFLLKASLAMPGGSAAFRAALAPILCRIAARYG